MGVQLQPLEFSDCLNDSPQFRENLQKHEIELLKTSQQIKKLIKEVKDLIQAARTLSRAQRTFADSLMSFSFECIGGSQTDDELVITKSLKEFGKLINAIEDERDRILDQSDDRIIRPLQNFRNQRIKSAQEEKKKFEKQTSKFCQTQEKYLNASTKKKQDNDFVEADAQLDMAERYFCQASLDYVFCMQELQERKKFEFVETIVGFMISWLTFYHQGYEIAKDFQPYMSDLQLRIQRTRENFNETRNKTETLKKKMLELRQQINEPTKEPKASVSIRSGAVNSKKSVSKEGYLFLMEKKAFGTTWAKHYCTYNKKTKEFTMTPFNQLNSKSFPPPSVMVLTSCTRRMTDTIEKRFCFDLVCGDRPLMTFQALSEDDRKAWMDVMDGKEPTYTSLHTHPEPFSAVPVEGRELDDSGFYFVKRCIETLESRGLDEQGLYRIVGVTSKVQNLLSLGLDMRKFEKISLDDRFEWESKTITSALKTYLRTLHEPIMTYKYYNSFIIAAKQETWQMRVHDVHFLIHKLPGRNIELLDIIINHLKNVAAKSDKNLMPVSNLAVCFGPTLLKPEEETVASIMDLKFYNVIVEILIENYETIFKSAPPPPVLQQFAPSVQDNYRQIIHSKANSDNVSMYGSSSNRGSDTMPIRHSPQASATIIKPSVNTPIYDVVGGNSSIYGSTNNGSIYGSTPNVAVVNISDGGTSVRNYRSPSNFNEHSIYDSNVYVRNVSSASPPVIHAIARTHNCASPMTVSANPHIIESNISPGPNLDDQSFQSSHSGLNQNYAMPAIATVAPTMSPRLSSSSSSPVSSSSSTLSLIQQGIAHRYQSNQPATSSHYRNGANVTTIDTNTYPGSVERQINQANHSIYNVQAKDQFRDLSSDAGIYSQPDDDSNELRGHRPEKMKRSISNQHSDYPSNTGHVRVRTLYNCLGENDGELSFQPNQIITNVKPSLELGWLIGTLNGKTGLVPENYVEMLP